MSAHASAETYEEQHVHSVYESIASHFSATRYKPWPIVETFLRGQSDGAVGIDAGCGNGKYLGVNSNVFIIGSDRSTNLVAIAKTKAPVPHSVVVADALGLPHRPHTMDFAISIAVVHHLSSSERRVAAIAALLEQLKPGGRALIYVWALEQKSSRRGWGEDDAQDVMVPWVLKAKQEEDKTYNRYYHLYRKGELETDIVAAGGRVIDAGYEKDNWWAIAEPA